MLKFCYIKGASAKLNESVPYLRLNILYSLAA